MQAKKIFITIPWFLPAFKAGGPVQSVNNMVEAFGPEYRFYIFTSNTDLHNQPIPVTTTGEWTTFSSNCEVWYATRKNRSENLTEQVKRLAPDVLMMIGIFSWHYTIVPLFFTSCRNKIVSVRGMMHPGALGEKKLKKKLFLSLFKPLALHRCRFHVSDEQEGDYVKKVMGETAKVTVAGNFPRLLPVSAPPGKSSGSLRLISVGLISPMKNYALVLEALKLVEGSVEYHIYGPVKEAGYWEECLQIIGELPTNIKVFYHKELAPHKLAGKLSENHVFILPSKSENFGHAIAEALSAGLPVITSHNTPWSELENYRAGINAEETTTAIAGAISFFLRMDNEEYLRHHSAAARYIRERVETDQLKMQYINMFGAES